MGKIVAIGGGSIGSNGTPYETEKADLEIVSLSNHSVPSVLYIGFANQNNPSLQNRMRTIYETYIHCKFNILEQQDLQTVDALDRKIDAADIIYVSGGDSFLLMEIVKKTHLAKALETAFINDKVLCGISAGALCWFKYGCSAVHQQNTEFDLPRIPHRVSGLGLLDFLFCPHYHDAQRRHFLYQVLMCTPNITAIGLDHAALISEGAFLRVMPLAETAIAQTLRYDGQSVVETPLLLNYAYRVEHLLNL